MFNFHVSHSHSSAERCSDLQMKHTTQRDFKKSKIIEKKHLITKLVMTGSQQENILSIKPPTLILSMNREPICAWKYKWSVPTEDCRQLHVPHNSVKLKAGIYFNY